MTAAALEFSQADLARDLPLAGDEELDLLDFGVVEMSLLGHVLRYNAMESRLSGLPPDRVIGRHFFTEVAPCTNNRKVAQRFNEAALDETIAYTFALRLKAVPVTLRMLKAEGGDTMYLLVRWA